MLHVFDLDGTLLLGTTASLEIARVLGSVDDLVTLEREFAARRIDTRGFAKRISELWSGLTAETVREAFETSPFLEGIGDVVADIRARGEISAVITMTPNFYADHLSDFGFDHVASSVFPNLPLCTAPDPTKILVPESKVTITAAWLAAHGFAAHECVAYGDSLSDVPLFSVIELGIAINASEELRALADYSYVGDDLREPYAAARAALALQPC